MSKYSQISFPVQLRQSLNGKDDKPSASDFLFMEHYKNTSIQDIPGEEWKEFGKKSKHCTYFISSKGRIKSIHNILGERILKQGLSKGGYLNLGSAYRKVFPSKIVHRLVGLCFLPYSENIETINHIDFNKLNNESSNLEWMSFVENVKNAWDEGKVMYRVGELSSGAILSNEDALQIYKSKLTIIELSKKYGVSYRTIYWVKIGRTFKNVTGGKRNIPSRIMFSKSDINEICSSKHSVTELSNKFGVSKQKIWNIKYHHGHDKP